MCGAEAVNYLRTHFTPAELRKYSNPLTEDLEPVGAEAFHLAQWFLHGVVVDSNAASRVLDPWVREVLRDSGESGQSGEDHPGPGCLGAGVVPAAGAPGAGPQGSRVVRLLLLCHDM